MSTLTDKLLQYANNSLNVLLIGPIGVGKTTVAKKVADLLNLKFKYYSTPTLDPWADLVGIPVPDISDREKKLLDFFRPKGLQDAEFILFDELNRAHPRTLNAVLEIIQFKSINGERLPNLKMIWAAINPPGGQYQVEDLDPALVDRFHVYVEMKAVIDKEYMKTVMKNDTIEALSAWWYNDCDEKQREYLSPRRIEYIGKLVDAGIPWKDSLPLAHTFPAHDLSLRLQSSGDGQGSQLLTTSKSDILNNLQKYIDKVKEDPSFVFKFKNFLLKFKEEEFFIIKDLLEMMPPDILNEIARKKFRPLREKLRLIFDKNKISLSEYPNLSNTFFSYKNKI